MRLETSLGRGWSLSGASKIGHDHVYRGLNCQDAFAFNTQRTNFLQGKLSVDDEWCFGVVCDGCGGVVDDNGNPIGHTEVGSNLLSDQIVRSISYQLRRYFSERTDADAHSLKANSLLESMGHGADFYEKIIQAIINDVYKSCVDFIWKQMRCRTFVEWGDTFDAACAEYTKYIEKYWLATIVGFLFNETDGIVFSAGDGVVVIDDQIIKIEQDNAPHYLAYNCIMYPERFGVTPDAIPLKFQTLPTMDMQKVKRLMIATDGFDNHHVDRLGFANLPNSLHGEQWGKTGQFGLKKWMNAKSQLGYFDDDCAIITAESKSI